MLEKLSKIILVLTLTLSVSLGAYLGLLRFLSETQSRTVELVVDLNGLKKLAAYEKKPLGWVLAEIKKRGISEVGVFEETLPDANSLGELYYAKGSGILRLPNGNQTLSNLARRGKIKPDRTYIYISEDAVRGRVFNHLKLAVGGNAIRFVGRKVIEVDEAEEELRTLGLGISESQKNFIESKGFTLIPRISNDPRFHLGNIGPKINFFKDYGAVIFDGEEILGYPDALPALADALKANGLRYGYVEIVKQDGDVRLKKLMGGGIVRVHSVPKDELLKISKEEALDRFARAARERRVGLIYLRPFLPPQVDAYPVEYNLKYFGELKNKLENSGFVLGKAEKINQLKVSGWQVLILGAGVMIAGLFLLGNFVSINAGAMLWLAAVGTGAAQLVLMFGQQLLLQKALIFSAAVIFPSYAVISTFSKSNFAAYTPFLGAIFTIINILAETSIGIFLIIGLGAEYRFMGGIEAFPAVKAALLLPSAIVGAYFIKDRWRNLLESKVSLSMVLAGTAVLAAMGVLIARSGNFILPVPAFEKYFRNWLELLLYIRPRTKEFLIGYPLLFLAALQYMKGKTDWLWLLAAVGVIAPVSVFNSFSHFHTPLVVSVMRTFNGLALGIIFGVFVGWLSAKLAKSE